MATESSVAVGESAVPAGNDVDPDRAHLFVSPHYDDIALSCGGLVAALSARGAHPVIAVVFGERPDPALPLTAFAASLHDQWRLSADEVVTARRAEEAAAAAILGATTEVLPFHDAIYRGARYTGDDALFGEPAAAEADLPPAVAAAIPVGAAPDTATRVYVPLAVGGHVDHRHAFLAGLILARGGSEVRFYEDLPYALRPGGLEARLEAAANDVGAPLIPAELVPVAATWEAKIAAILAYPSQLETIFRQYVGVEPTREGISAALLAYATTAGDGTPVERYWRLSG